MDLTEVGCVCVDHCTEWGGGAPGAHRGMTRLQVVTPPLVHHCCCSVTHSCLSLCYSMDCSTPSFPVFHISWSLLKLMSIESVILSNRLILCRCLLFLPSIFPRIRVFSSELALHIRWSKYWNFTFSISPSSEYSGLISFSIYWFDFLAVHHW